jgi:hypothetical protein
MKKRMTCFLLIAVFVFLGGVSVAQAQAKTILFVPIDDRPVSLQYVVDTAHAAHLNIMVPPEKLLASRGRKGQPDKIWQWVMENCRQADALVLSSDTLIYGGLVDSRTHHFDEKILQQRLARFKELSKANPIAGIYVFSTVLRTPQASYGGVEPPYYKKYGWDIFEWTALQDKAETTGLTKKEKKLLKAYGNDIPAADKKDWIKRRERNFKINSGLIDLDKAGVFRYLLLGRDDTSPYCQTHREGRYLTQYARAQGLPVSQFETFPGADQLGMVMLARAYNDLTVQIPIVKVEYAEGTGPNTVPSYEDQPVGKSIVDHVTAAGGIVLSAAQHPDLIVAVNTPFNGKTLEASSTKNTYKVSGVVRRFVDKIAAQIRSGQRVAIANIAFANGSENALMEELARRHLLGKLAAYSGWNTASNTMGYAVGQGMMSASMSNADRKKLLAERYLDDWAYQANIRKILDNKIVYPNKGSLVNLSILKPLLTARAEKLEQQFAKRYLWLDPDKIQVSFPWNRMFELRIRIKP